MPGNLRYQNSGSQRRALNSHQKSRHGYQHDISDAFVSDNTVLHCNQSHKPPQQATCDQSGDKVSPRQPGRDGTHREAEMQQHDSKHPHHLRTAVLSLFQQKLLATARQVHLHQ